jgi:outer membrane protein OmpA-like peptidoglycan-associated protein
VNEPGDVFEQEADRVAEQVMRMPDPDATARPDLPAGLASRPSRGAPTLQRKCACGGAASGCTSCKAEDVVKLQRKAAAPDGATTAPPIVHDVLRSPGQPLDPATRGFMETRFGRDFGDVRVHSDRAAAESARAVGARAYTAGQAIAFADGEYRPDAEQGRRLLAHELTHVVQQSAGDHGYLRRLGDLRQVPAVLSCEIPATRVPANHEFVLFSNRGTSLNAAGKRLIGNYVERYHASGSSEVVRVDGFASEPGDDSLNWLLSCNRASAVKDELMHSTATRDLGLPDSSIKVFMQGETAEFGTEAQNRRATILPQITGTSGAEPSEDAEAETPTPQDTAPSSSADNRDDNRVAPTDAGSDPAIPPPLPSCAVNPDCPSDFCLPFATRQEALDDRARDGDSVLSTIAGLNPHAEELFRRYIFEPEPAGDISAEYAADFTASRTTRDVSEQIHALVKADIQSNPPAVPADGFATVDYQTDPSKDALKQQFNQLATSGLVYADPFEVPGLIAGGVSQGQGFCNVGANTSGAQDDSRSARVRAEVFKNTDGTLAINPIVEYTAVDTIDFCPGNCGGYFALRFGNTVQMSRWEASGVSGDVPFTVVFQGPSLIGAYNSEDE